MGAVASSRHRSDEFAGNANSSPSKNSSSTSNRIDTRIAKKPRLSLFNQARDFFGVPRSSECPRTKPRRKRGVHAPCRAHKFGSPSKSSKAARNWESGIGEGVLGEDMGNALTVWRKCEVSRKDLLGPLNGRSKDKEDKFDDSSVEVIEIVEDVDGGLVCSGHNKDKDDKFDDSSVEVIEIVEDGDGGSVRSGQNKAKEDKFDDSSVEVIEIVEDGDGGSVCSGHSLQEVNGLTESSWKIDGAIQASSSDVDYAGNMLNSLSLSPNGVPMHKKLTESASRHSYKLQSEIQLQDELWESFKFSLRENEPDEVEAVESAYLREPFVPLNEEDEKVVARALSNSNRTKVLVSHESSNIEITGELLQCLRPRAWLNDEVINLYLELLKERENREPKKFLMCHFFNTFFYKKLTGGGNGYDYKSVRRWTTQRKLGYSLIECDKIFVPIHKKVHWCLAVINKKDEKFQFLDSLGGKDSRVLKVLARYFVDEVKDKSGQDINVSSWERESVKDLPVQENGFDCGVFMIKYADFYSRGMGLDFNQDHMPYFRRRTAKEILKLRAD